MDLDEQLENLEDSGETEAELIDQETELEDYESDDDQIFDGDALETDYEHAYDSFISENEEDYNGWDPDEVDRTAQDEEDAEILNGEGYHVIDREDLRDDVVEMEIDEDDIEAYLVDEDGNEIGFTILDDEGNEVEYYYADEDDDDEIAQKVSDDNMKKELADERAVKEEKEFDLGITREGVREMTGDLNAIYKDGKEVATELKDAFDDISDTLSFFKKKK